MYELFILGKI